MMEKIIEQAESEPVMNRRNFKHTRSGHVDCEIEHPVYGWIPYTLGPDEEVPEGETVADADLMSADILMSEVNVERDRLFNKHEWRIARNQREIRLGLTLTESTEALDNYFQALADITEQPGYPQGVQWPDEPAT